MANYTWFGDMYFQNIMLILKHELLYQQNKQVKKIHKKRKETYFVDQPDKGCDNAHRPRYYNQYTLNIFWDNCCK